MRTIIERLKQFWKNLSYKGSLDLNKQAATIPEALGVSPEVFDQLTNEMFNMIKDEDRLASFDDYLQTILFKRYNLNLNDNRHAALIGFAFCAALMMQRNAKQQLAVQEVLHAFYPTPTPAAGSNSVN